MGLSKSVHDTTPKNRRDFNSVSRYYALKIVEKENRASRCAPFLTSEEGTSINGGSFFADKGEKMSEIIEKGMYFAKEEFFM